MYIFPYFLLFKHSRLESVKVTSHKNDMNGEKRNWSNLSNIFVVMCLKSNHCLGNLKKSMSVRWKHFHIYLASTVTLYRGDVQHVFSWKQSTRQFPTVNYMIIKMCLYCIQNPSDSNPSGNSFESLYSNDCVIGLYNKIFTHPHTQRNKIRLQNHRCVCSHQVNHHHHHYHWGTAQSCSMGK